MSIDYIAGFSKTAAAYGVDPAAIVKIAAGQASQKAPSPAPANAGGKSPPSNGIMEGLGGISNSISAWWNGLDNDTRTMLKRTAMGVGAGGLASMIFGNGSFGSVLGNGLLGGLGSYAMHRSGYTDAGLKYLQNLADLVTTQADPSRVQSS